MEHESKEAIGRETPQRLKGKSTREGKYLTFSLKNEEYGIEILKVKEIIGIMNITTMPQTPPYVKGVINLRGKIIPVVDLRLKFGMEAPSYTDRTCIVVVDTEGRDKGNFFLGIVVDSVSEVLTIRNDEIEDTPNFGVSLENDYFLGMAKAKGSVKILLDIDRVLTCDLTIAGKLLQ